MTPIRHCDILNKNIHPSVLSLGHNESWGRKWCHTYPLVCLPSSCKYLYSCKWIISLRSAFGIIFNLHAAPGNSRKQVKSRCSELIITQPAKTMRTPKQKYKTAGGEQQQKLLLICKTSTYKVKPAAYLSIHFLSPPIQRAGQPHGHKHAQSKNLECSTASIQTARVSLTHGDTQPDHANSTKRHLVGFKPSTFLLWRDSAHCYTPALIRQIHTLQNSIILCKLSICWVQWKVHFA